MERRMLPDLPGWMWLGIAAIPVTAVGLMILVYLLASRAEARHYAERKSMFDAYFASRGSRCSDEAADRGRVEAALVDLLGGGSFDILWTARADAGTLFEYRTGADLRKRGYGYLERSPLAGLETTLKIFPRSNLPFTFGPVFNLGPQVGEGWANAEFHRRFGIVARDAADASRSVTSGLQSLLLDLPEVSFRDDELVELAVNGNHLAVLGRKWDRGAKSGDRLPDLENHLRLAIRIRDELGR